MSALPSNITNNPATLSARAASLYQDASFPFRLMQTYRPYICPFDRIIPFVPAGSTVLDIGCGAGLFLGLLGATGKIDRGIGFDVGGQAIAAAKKMAGRLGDQQSRIEFRRLDVADQWPAGPFDVVTMIDVLHHVPPAAQESVIRRALQQVRPGGRFIYKDMAQRPVWRAAWNRLHDLLIARDWIHYAAIGLVEEWGSRTGATIEHGSTVVNCGLYQHELRVFRVP